jgi:hypothetical protein
MCQVGHIEGGGGGGVGDRFIGEDFAGLRRELVEAVDAQRVSRHSAMPEVYVL